MRIKRARKHPTSLYDGTELLQVTREHLAIPITLIRADMELLIQSFMSKEQHFFKTFETVWKELQFDHIHFACVYDSSRQAFMNTLYAAVLDHFAINIDVTKMGVIYALYYLFKTQPRTWEIHSIRVDKDQWAELFNFYIYCCRMEDMEHAQAAMIFKQLMDDLKAFTFVMDRSLEMMNMMEKNEKSEQLDLIEGFQQLQKRRFQNEVTASCYGVLSDEIGSLARQYQNAKQAACTTPQATLAAQQWIKSTLNIHETDKRKLQNVMLKSVLTSKDATLGDSLRRAAQGMWKERASVGSKDQDILLPQHMPLRVLRHKKDWPSSQTPKVEPATERPDNNDSEEQQVQVGDDGDDDEVFHSAVESPSSFK